MARSRAEVGELIAKVFDRLEKEFPGAHIEDAILLVELQDPNDMVEVEDGREFPATLVLLEGTTERLVVQHGLIDYASKTILDGGASEAS